MATLIRTTEVAGLLADLEDLWRCVDELFDSLSPRDWSRRHGPDWTYADLPYHLSYFDEEIVLNPIARGVNVPLEEQRVMRTLTDLNGWNARMFARRPADETPERSRARMRAVRAGLRGEIARLDDDDLERPVFMDMVGAGWVPARLALTAGVAHTWTHLQEARLRRGRRGPLPSHSATHRTLGFFMDFMPRFADAAEVAKGPFTIVMAFTGPGGGAWTIRAADGAVSTTEGATPDPDLTLTQSPETFEKTHSKLTNPMILMLTGQIKVKGWRNMGRFGKLLAVPGPGTIVEPFRERL
jgi:hypothetical protein